MYPVPESRQGYFPNAYPAVDVDGFLARVYGWMAAGLGLTGATALGVAITPALQQLIFGTPLFWGLIIAQFIVVLAFVPLVHRVSPMVAGGLFLFYSLLTGATLSSIFLVYTASSIATTFFVTAGTFGALSAFALLTKRSLAGWGSFLFIGLVGIVIASVVNIFLQSPAIYWVTTFAGVLVFAGLTAYDTQKLKEMAWQAGPNSAVSGALMLYLDFINLFLMLLRIFGSRRD